MLQSTKPLPKLKRKTVYFVKISPEKLDNDNIKTLVSAQHMIKPARPACFDSCPAYSCPARAQLSR